jgi:predicted nucleic acid-binding protein
VRVVLDTNILVRANPQALPASLARELLLTILAEPHTLVLSAPILTEARRVFRYPHVQARWPLSDEAIATYFSLLEAAASMVELPSEIPAVVSDPDDDPILQTAILGGGRRSLLKG